jgi:hypothetical protein
MAITFGAAYTWKNKRGQELPVESLALGEKNVKEAIDRANRVYDTTPLPPVNRQLILGKEKGYVVGALVDTDKSEALKTVTCQIQGGREDRSLERVVDHFAEQFKIDYKA